jgi:ribosomal protein L32
MEESMDNHEMPTQVNRCPKCGKLYRAEDGQCPNCFPVREGRRGRETVDPLTVRMRWLISILVGVWALLTGAALVISYLTRSRQEVIEGILIPVTIIAVMLPWIFLAMLVVRLADNKGRNSTLWLILAILIPVSPLVSIPLLLLLPSKSGSPMDWKGNLGMAASFSAIFSGVILLVFSWLIALKVV